MSCSGDNYRELLDGQATLNLEPCLLSWKYNLTNLRNDMYTFNELIDIRDGIKECNGFTKADIYYDVLCMCFFLITFTFIILYYLYYCV